LELFLVLLSFYDIVYIIDEFCICVQNNSFSGSIVGPFGNLVIWILASCVLWIQVTDLLLLILTIAACKTAMV